MYSILLIADGQRKEAIITKWYEIPFSVTDTNLAVYNPTWLSKECPRLGFVEQDRKFPMGR